MRSTCSPIVRATGTMFAALTALLVSVAPTAAQAPTAPTSADLVQRAARALGGESALRAVSQVRTQFIATTFGLGQEETWASAPRPTVAAGRTTLDLARGRRATVQENRLPTATAATNVRQVVLADFGFTETNGTFAGLNAPALSAARRAIREQPDRLVLFALDNPAAVRRLPTRRWREETVDGVRVVNGTDSIALYFDRLTGRPLLTVTVTDDPILGDRTTEVAYTRWTLTGDVYLPRQVDTYANGRHAGVVAVAAAMVNGTADDADFAIADSVQARVRTAATVGAAPIAVTLVSLGTGVWRAEGGSHHSLVVEQGNGLLVVEAPQSAARVGALLDTLASRFPGRAVTQLVNTHHHWDHAGGVREFLARGIPVLTHPRNVAFVTRLAAAPKTIAPDALSRRARRPVIRAVTDSMVIGTGASQVIVIPIATAHAEGMLAAYVPSAGALFTSDIMNPAPVPNVAGAVELLAFARAHGFQVRSHAGGHGVVMSWSDVERAVQR